jgi:hypothetical protein
MSIDRVWYLVRWPDRQHRDEHEYFAGSVLKSEIVHPDSRFEEPLFWAERDEATRLDLEEARALVKRAWARGCKGARVVKVSLRRVVRQRRGVQP